MFQSAYDKFEQPRKVEQDNIRSIFILKKIAIELDQVYNPNVETEEYLIKYTDSRKLMVGEIRELELKLEKEFEFEFEFETQTRLDSKIRVENWHWLSLNSA